ncbi:sugar ABC transporter substrate-binding protein [Bradyrhizobium sp. dw_411]|uniref:ABC transporter substrate-binding protein n=1 Tax=Bradyrhizobium sp. dw_411 TaxID=2720082 RepID=UPI001BCE1C53|nr:sugar ABC transporter substrate-binding protein [Bradyrhizobium sp. dw_411]
MNRYRRLTKRVLPLAIAIGFWTGMTLCASAQKVVNIWHTEPNPATIAAMNEIIAKFEKENPGIKVIQEAVGWADLDKKMQTALASGALPEASHGQTYIERSLAAKGLLRPLDDVVASIGEDDIFDVVKKLDYNTKEKKYYGLAHAVGADLIVYRKDFLREAGIPEQAPKTWREWLDQLKKLTVDTPKGKRYGLTLAGQGFWANEDLYMWVGSNGGRLFADNGRPTFTEKPVLETLEFWKELSDCCVPPDWLSQDYLGSVADVAVGKAAMVMSWGRASGYFEQYAPDQVKNNEFGVFNVKPLGPNGKEFLTQFDCEPWMIFKDSKNPEEAAAFLKFFFRPDNYLTYVKSVPIQLFPITKSMQSNPGYQALPEIQKWKFWVEAQKNIIQSNEPKPLLITRWQDLDLPFIAEIAGSGILSDMVIDVMKNGKTPLESATRAQKRAETLIGQLGYANW